MDFWDTWLDSSGLNCQCLILIVRERQQGKDKGPWEETSAFGTRLRQKLYVFQVCSTPHPTMCRRSKCGTHLMEGNPRKSQDF
eukprot:12889106-Prorocentrum_lima.AAC.1